MNKNLKIILFGFLVWLIPFLVAFAIFPLRVYMRPLFESIMPLTLTIIVVMLAYYYLKNMEVNFVKEGMIIGFAWFIINIAIDLTMFMPASPMQMSFVDYMMDIGLTYVMIPVITVGMGYMAQNKVKTP
ncbi:MAG: hypothetical protein PQ975_04170 [Methanobacterium sp.]|jgi:4-amino-4-deoxy-L-arabinose transferase-like glycosyltransferase